MIRGRAPGAPRDTKKITLNHRHGAADEACYMIIKLGAGKLNINEAAAVTGGYVVGPDDASFWGICTDSREAGEGILFVALRGERSDGHDFIPTACKAGSPCVIAERHDGLIPGGVAALIVPDAQSSLSDLAAAYRSRSECRRVAVTGSVGKTTTKEFVSAVLGESFRTHKTRGNFNSLIGMPLSLLETPADSEISVLEMAMNTLGEIERMSLTARPDIALITNIGSSHMEMLGSRENICRAKFEVMAGLKPGGFLLLNGDEPMMLNYPGRPANTLYIAIRNRAADYFAHNIRAAESGTLFDISSEGGNIRDIRIPALGNHNVYAASYAYAVGSLCGMSEEAIRRGLMKYRSADMRQRIYRLSGLTVIEDCYNASPESMRAAIDVLCALRDRHPGSEKSPCENHPREKLPRENHSCEKLPCENHHCEKLPCETLPGRAVALLGDMRELGINSEMYHRSVGAYAAERGVDLLFTLGNLARGIASGAIAAGMSDENIYVNIDENTYAATAAELSGLLREGDILLLKASRALRAERVLVCLREIYKVSE